MKFAFFFLSLICVFLVHAESVYKTVDEHGNVIFTDKPSENAEEIKLQELQTIENPNKPSYRAPQPKIETQDPYQLITITSPANDASVRSNNGDFTISVAVEPGLRPGHTITITMDGRPVSSDSSTTVSIKNADRGTHNLGASVKDSNGKSLISTSSTVHILRASQ